MSITFEFLQRRYINGQRVASGVAPPGVAAFQLQAFGGFQSIFYSGSIDSATLFGSSLSSELVSMLYATKLSQGW